MVNIIASKMTYSEFESDSYYASNSGSDSNSESDFSSFYICISVNKLNNSFVHSHNRINSYTGYASVIHNFF